MTKKEIEQYELYLQHRFMLNLYRQELQRFREYQKKAVFPRAYDDIIKGFKDLINKYFYKVIDYEYENGLTEVK